MRIGASRRGRRYRTAAVRRGSRFLVTDHHPLTPLLLKVVLHRHGLRRVALGRNGHAGVRLAAVDLNRRERDFHGGHVHPNLSQALQDRLAHGLAVLGAAVAGSQAKSQQNDRADSHY